MPKQNKLMQLVKSRLRLTLLDGRILVGQLLAYDKHLNLVLADVEEFRTTKATSKKSNDSTNNVISEPSQQRRSLGFLVLRGKHIVSMVPEGVPDVNRARIPAASQMGRAATTLRSGTVPAPGAPVMGPPPGMFTGMPYTPGTGVTMPPPAPGTIPGMMPGVPMPPPSHHLQ